MVQLHPGPPSLPFDRFAHPVNGSARLTEATFLPSTTMFKIKIGYNFVAQTPPSASRRYARRSGFSYATLTAATVTENCSTRSPILTVTENDPTALIDS